MEPVVLVKEVKSAARGNAWWNASRNAQISPAVTMAVEGYAGTVKRREPVWMGLVSPDVCPTAQGKNAVTMGAEAYARFSVNLRWSLLMIILL